MMMGSTALILWGVLFSSILLYCRIIILITTIGKAITKKEKSLWQAGISTKRG